MAMKKIFMFLSFVAVAAMGLTACHNEFEETNVNNPEVIPSEVLISFVADATTTRTAVDTSSDEAPVFSWSDDETFTVLEQTDALVVSSNVTYEKVEGKANITAAFATNEGKAEYKYVTVYPESGFVSAESIDAATLQLPATQTMAEASYDPNADLMVSKPVVVDAQPTAAQQVAFTRVAAVVKMTLKNFELEAGDEVERVIFTAEGEKTLAGSVNVDLNAPHEFTVNEGVNSVSVATKASDDIYFNVLPTVLEAGDAYTITVVTNKRLYVKQGKIAEGKTLTLEAGMVNRFGVNMQGVVASEKWVLVRDASTLEAGDIVTIATKNYNYVIGKQSASYPLASVTEAIKVGDYLYHPIPNNKTSADSRMQYYTLMQRDANRVAFDFYNGVDYKDDTTIGFVYANGTNSSPTLQAYCDVNTLFDITIKDGIATLCASDIVKTYKYWRYYHSNYSASSRKFDCTTSEPTGNNQVCIYKLESRKGTIPVLDAHFTVPEEVVIPEEGAAVATPINDVVFNYVGDWTITVEAEDEADWLNVAYDAVNNYLTYTAEANAGDKRNTSVTITASMEGKESIVRTFKLTQKGAPEEVSIADFIKKPVDVNVSYKITGIVTVASTTEGGYYSLSDENGNVAQVRYVYTDGGDILCEQNLIEVGDVMTVTTVVTTSKGKGGSSSQHSIYKGHFNIEATTSGAVGYEGGDVTINIAVNKYGHIVAPTVISDNSNVATDGNPITAYSFTDNGDGTATAVATFSENTTGGSRKVDLTFSSGSPLVVSTSITIMQDVNPALKKGWWLVTDVNDLEAGDKIIIAATGLDYAISTASNTNSRKSTAITRNGGALENVSSSVQQYALEIDANGLYSFKGTLGGDADKYIYAPNTKNYMKVTKTLDNQGKWTITIAGDGTATITSQGAETYKYMQYNNKAASSPAFYCTDGSLGAVCLYKYFE